MIKGDPWRFLLGVGWVGRTLLKEGPSGLRTEKYDESSLVRSGSELSFGRSGNNQCKDLKARQGSAALRNGRKAGLCALEDRQEGVLRKAGASSCCSSVIPNLQHKNAYSKKEGRREGKKRKEGKKERKEGWMDE